MRRTLVLGLALLSLAIAAPASAQEDIAEEADLAFQIGVDHYQRGEFRQALVALLRSNRLVPNKNVVFNIARCYENLGQFENAYQRYTDYVAMEDVEADRKAGEDALERISKNVALVEVSTTPQGATVFLDRRDLGPRGTSPRTLAVDPGAHTVIVDLDGYVSNRGDVNVKRGAKEAVSLELEQILGTLELVGTPAGATVTLEGSDEPLGTLPLKAEVPPGQMTLIIEAPGYATRRQLVNLGIEGPLKVDASLELLTGKLVVDASERGSLIEIDGEAFGFTPAVVQVPIGAREITISKRGYAPYTEQLDVTENAVIERDVKLVRSGLLSVTVTTATKSERTARKTPAVVTVVERDEIVASGYRNIAEILETVPGFYDIYDMVFHNMGVRGVSGGARSSGNNIKLMIDGQPVSYRPTTGNFFGEELVPIDAIERIEIIRGPASALYGANAYLGVINVITRTSGGSAVVGQGGLVADNPAWGAGITVQANTENINTLASVSHTEIDRSGLGLPATSPALDLAASGLDKGDRSRNDTSTPDSMLAKVVVGQPDEGSGEWTLWGSVQRLDAGGEFQDFEPMTNQTRIALENRTLRLGWKGTPIDDLTFDARAVMFDSRPTDADQIGTGRTDAIFLRSVQAVGQEAGLEVSFLAGENFQGIVGVDYSHEEHTTQSYNTLFTQDSGDRSAGEIIPGPGGRKRALNNLGVFAQGLLDVGSSVTLNVGARIDRHNIYSQAISPRAGVVLAPPDAPWSGKLLFGSSFKAPSAEQLFTQALGPGDISGNPQLDAQFARTLELAGTYSFDQYGEVEANVFYTQVQGLVEYLLRENLLEAENAVDEDIGGAELAARINAADWWTWKVGAGVATLVSQTLDEEQARVFNLDELPLTYPSLQAHIGTTLRLPSYDVRFTPEISYVGARSASQSNIVSARGDQYTLDPYVMLSVSLSAPTMELVPGYRTSVALRGTDLLASHGPDPGVNGIDYPALGRQLWLTVNQGF